MRIDTRIGVGIILELNFVPGFDIIQVFLIEARMSDRNQIDVCNR
jgi:hypothetical protein